MYKHSLCENDQKFLCWEIGFVHDCNSTTVSLNIENVNAVISNTGIRHYCTDLVALEAIKSM